MRISLVYLFVIAFVSNGCFPAGNDRGKIVLNSLEGDQVNINLKFDNVSQKITVSLPPSENLCISDYVADNRVEKIEVKNGKFLFLSFCIRGGSGVGLGATICICVSKGHLYKALDIISRDDESFTVPNDNVADSQGLYYGNTTSRISVINLKEDMDKGYKLIATEYYKAFYKHTPAANSESLDTLKLNFDSGNKVFYTKDTSLNGTYSIINDPNVFPPKTEQRDFNDEEYPCVENNEGSYMFVDGEWYMLNPKKKLLVREWDICK